MPKQKKKVLRKIKDKLVHSANDIKSEHIESGLASGEGLDHVHDLLIEAINGLLDYINTGGRGND